MRPNPMNLIAFTPRQRDPEFRLRTSPRQARFMLRLRRAVLLVVALDPATALCASEPFCEKYDIKRFVSLEGKTDGYVDKGIDADGLDICGLDGLGMDCTDKDGTLVPIVGTYDEQFKIKKTACCRVPILICAIRQTLDRDERKNGPSWEGCIQCPESCDFDLCPVCDDGDPRCPTTDGDSHYRCSCDSPQGYRLFDGPPPVCGVSGDTRYFQWQISSPFLIVDASAAGMELSACELPKRMEFHFPAPDGTGYCDCEHADQTITVELVWDPSACPCTLTCSTSAPDCSGDGGGGSGPGSAGGGGPGGPICPVTQPRPTIRAGNASFSPTEFGSIPYQAGVAVRYDEGGTPTSVDYVYQVPDAGIAYDGSPYVSASTDGPNDISGGTIWELKNKVKIKSTQMEYVFDATRTGTGYSSIYAWGDERLNLSEIRRVGEDNTVSTKVRCYETTVGGQRVPSTWQDASNGALSLDFEYDSGGLLTRVESSEGQFMVLEYEYSAYGGSTNNTAYRLTSISNSCESCPSYTYEYDGVLLTKVKDAVDTTIAAYDYCTYSELSYPVLTKAYRAIGTTVFNMYDAVYDLTGNKVTYYNYQSDTRKQAIVDEFQDDALSNLTKRSYYRNTTSSTPSGNADVVEYDYTYSGTYLQSFEATMPRGNVHRWLLPGTDPGANLITKYMVDDASSAITMASYTFDSPWESVEWPLLSMTDVRGSVTTYDYDRNPNLLLTKTIDPSFGTIMGSRQHTTNYAYDNQYRLTRTTRRTSSDAAIYTDYVYDDYDHVTLSVEDAGGQNLTSQFVYDGAGRLRTAQDPRGVKRVSSYTPNGALSRQYTLDSGGSDALELTIYKYDDLDRLTRQCQALSDSAISSPESYSSTTVDTLYLYDPLGRRTGVVADAGGSNLTTSYAYDNLDRVLQVTTPGGIYTTVERDGRGRKVRQIIGASGGNNLTTAYEYDGNSNLTRVTEPNGTVMTYDYDLFDRRNKSTRS